MRISISQNSVLKFCLIWIYHVEKKKFGGARIEDIQKNVSDLLASESMDCGTQLIIHVGTNNLVNGPEDVVVRKMELLVTETKTKVKSIAISSVITRKDVPVIKIARFNNLVRVMCSKMNVDFLDNHNLTKPHLNGSGLHLNSDGDKILGSNFCRYLRSPKVHTNRRPVKYPNTSLPGFLGKGRNHRPPRHMKQDKLDTASWDEYLRWVRSITHWENRP